MDFLRKQNTFRPFPPFSPLLTRTTLGYDVGMTARCEERETTPGDHRVVGPGGFESRTFTPLADALVHLLASPTDGAQIGQLWDMAPFNERDRYATLLTIYDLHTAPLDRIGDRVRFQHHPVVSNLKERCERDWLTALQALEIGSIDTSDVPAAMRAIAARNRLPRIYRWLAKEASWPEVVRFLTLEGGPDAGFDDLVAGCQIGLAGAAKLELASNYWDEMGNGTLADVHTALHDRLVAAVDMPKPDLTGLPTSALARSALCGLLATNRWLQPEMLGALGLIELQAGPRCRMVLNAFDRLDAPADAYPFYEVHADVDPGHGKDWLENAIAPTVADHPDWGPRIIAGALWREFTTEVFLNDVERLLAGGWADVGAPAA